MTNNNLEFHPLIAPFANSFAAIVAGILGWRLVSLEEFLMILQDRGGNDRVALASRVMDETGDNVTFSFRGSVQPLVSGESDHQRLLSNCAMPLVGHCWEILRTQGHVPRNDLAIVEFLRHIRNGCFHGNSFHFRGNEPRHQAEWRGLRITRANDGQTIFRADLTEPDFFLNWGDPLLLLHDISRVL